VGAVRRRDWGALGGAGRGAPERSGPCQACAHGRSYADVFTHTGTVLRNHAQTYSQTQTQTWTMVPPARTMVHCVCVCVPCETIVLAGYTDADVVPCEPCGLGGRASRHTAAAAAAAAASGHGGGWRRRMSLGCPCGWARAVSGRVRRESRTHGVHPSRPRVPRPFAWAATRTAGRDTTVTQP
jgi:hypothetical protein